jgi:hypothetical protein
MKRAGRNDPCPCGSGKKYKKCCFDADYLIGAPRIIKLKMPSVLFLFGAGASKFSLGINNPPPLGTELYDALAKEFPASWGKLPYTLQADFREKSFESGMNRLRYEYASSISLTSHLKEMGIFFSRFIIDYPDKNLYYKLIKLFSKELLNRDIVLSTVNYDCLIERAIKSLASNYFYRGENAGIKLVKIHGSCNFISEAGKSVTGDISMMDIKERNQIETKIGEFIDPDDVEEALKKTFIPPVMSLYTQDKVILLAAPEIESMIKEFQVYVSSAKLVVTVGIRPNKDDKHIWDYLGNMSGALKIVCNEDHFREWNNYCKKGEFLGEEFALCFDEICRIIRDVSIS